VSFYKFARSEYARREYESERDYRHSHERYNNGPCAQPKAFFISGWGGNYGGGGIKAPNRGPIVPAVCGAMRDYQVGAWRRCVAFEEKNGQWLLYCSKCGKPDTEQKPYMVFRKIRYSPNCRFWSGLGQTDNPTLVTD